ncbi:MAG: M66 family metalloprotease [Polyangiaceae bacterium]
MAKDSMQFARLAVGVIGLALLGGAACSSEVVVVKAGDPAGGDEGATSDQSPTDPSGKPSDPNDPSAPSLPLATGVSIDDVAIFQAVKVDLAKDGAPVAASARVAPVVAKRPALVRVYVSPSASGEAQEITGELKVTVGGTSKVYRDTKTAGFKSTDDNLSSTFNFEVPAGDLDVGATFQVALTSKAGKNTTEASPARFPRDGSQAPLGVESSGEKLKIVVVPVRYDADGSGRVPDVGASQLELYRQTMMKLYPAAEVEVTARAPMPWSTVISRNGSGFSTILRAITELRQSDRVPSNVYYYGALAPAPSMSSFCGGGCVTGLSTVVNRVNDSFLRASVGVGFPGESSANTMAHELGHAHGRNHAPCGGANGVDPNFPHAGAGIGVWGYDILGKKLISPSKGKDFMGYCPNEWVSDYTFSALFDRVAAVNGARASQLVGGITEPTTWRIGSVDADGAVTFGHDDVTLDSVGAESVRDLTMFDGSDRVIGHQNARFYPFADLPGGLVLVPPTASIASVKRIAVTH